MSNYGANDIVSLSPGRAYREKIGMWLSADTQEAINLNVRECVVNAQDEHTTTKKKGGYCSVIINSAERTIRVLDNYRGIPSDVREDGINSLTATFLIPFSGGKHKSQSNYKSSVGVNASGVKIVTHTADWLEVKVKRGGKIFFQRFEANEDGAKEVAPVKVIGKCALDDTGTDIYYSPSKQVYGEHFVEKDVLAKLLQEISYFSAGMTLNLEYDGEKQTFISKNGLLDGLRSDYRIVDRPLHFTSDNGEVAVELALQWVSKKARLRGYANGLYVPDGGAFMTGFRTSLTRSFNSLAGTNFSGEQIRNMLDGYVSVSVLEGKYSNQQKTSLANPEARAPTSQAISTALNEFVENYPQDFRKIVDILLKEKKAEEAAMRAREAVLSHNKVQLEARKKKVILAGKLRDCEEHGEDSILIIAEGDSAGTALMGARDVSKTAILPIKGKIKNALKAPLEEVLQNSEVNDIILALGCGIEDKYNAKKLRYGSVYMAVDSDEDGKNILCLLAALFARLMPNFIREGRLKWLKAPLYKLDNGKNKWYAYNDEELEQLKKKAGRADITRAKGLGELTTADMRLTMMNEKDRRVEVLTLEDEEEAFEALEMLMGLEVAPRRNFILENIDFENYYE